MKKVILQKFKKQEDHKNMIDLKYPTKAERQQQGKMQQKHKKILAWPSLEE